MQSRPLIIVTTRLPPQICGVGTFSWQLERHWAGDTSSHRFLVVDGATDSKAALKSSAIAEFGQDWRALGRALEEAGSVNVLLHYAGRAYQKYGCPIGLPSVLRKWKMTSPNGRLVIFFHELPAHFPITSPHHWINACSRRVARKLANLADVLITNTGEHVRQLKEMSGRSDVQCLPVPSNINNTLNDSGEKARTEFVIFGLPFGRWQTLQMFDSEIRAWQKSGTLTKLHLIGPADDKFEPHSDALIANYSQPNVVVRHGELPAEQVSHVLSRAQFALTMANDSTWSKSATFMAYLGHGCVVISKSKSETEPLSWAISPEELTAVSDADLKTRGDSARRWYEANVDWKNLAAKISELIGNSRRRDT